MYEKDEENCLERWDREELEDVLRFIEINDNPIVKEEFQRYAEQLQQYIDVQKKDGLMVKPIKPSLLSCLLRAYSLSNDEI